MKNVTRQELKSILKEIVIQAHLGDPKARKIIQDIEELAEKSKIKASVQWTLRHKQKLAFVIISYLKAVVLYSRFINTFQKDY